MKISGAIVEAPGAPFQLAELELDEPRSDEAVVRVEAVGLCHTDLSFASGWGIPFPLLLGHEGAGVVERVGVDVTLVAPGDRVVISFAWCGACTACLDGHPALCASMPIENMGGFRPDGSATIHRNGQAVHANFFGQSSLATRALCREQHLVKIDPDTPFEVAAPLGCGVQTGAGAVLNVLRPEPGEPFAVFGAGAVGLSALLAAKLRGAHPIVVVEPHRSRRQLAQELGATAAFDPAEADLLDQLVQVSSGGFVTALDTSGNTEVIRNAFKVLRQRGALALVGVNDPCTEVTFPLVELMTGKRVYGTIEGDSVPRLFIPKLLRLWRAGLFPIERLCQVFPLRDISRAVEATRTGEVIKPVLLPQ
jgi:aryl-alcohol dehydrogenase